MLRILRFLKDPPAAFLIVIWVITVALVGGAVALMSLDYEGWPSYIVYVCAAVFLAYSVFAIVRCAPRIKAGVVERAKRRRFTNNLIGSYGFRTVVFFAVSFAINTGYALFNGVMGIIFSSVWYGVMSCYYIMLSAFRGAVLALSYRAKKRAADDCSAAESKLKIYRLCGAALFVLELALAGAVTLMILSDRPAAYSQIMAITSAAYTFYKVIFAVVNIVKARRLRDPMLQCFRNINLTDAGVSLLSLQVTMLAVFSEGDMRLASALNAVTGFVVCALTVVLGIIMIVGGSLRLKQLKAGKANE